MANKNNPAAGGGVKMHKHTFHVRTKPRKIQAGDYPDNEQLNAEWFVEKGDFVGLREFSQWCLMHSNTDDTAAAAAPAVAATNEKDVPQWLLWNAYARFHLCDFRGAIQMLDKYQKVGTIPKVINLYKAACYYHAEEYQKAHDLLEQSVSDSDDLKLHISYHTARAMHDDETFQSLHDRLISAAGSKNPKNFLTVISLFQRSMEIAMVMQATKSLIVIATETDRTSLVHKYNVALMYYTFGMYAETMTWLDKCLRMKSNSLAVLNLLACLKYMLDEKQRAHDIGKVLMQMHIDGHPLHSHIKHNVAIYEAANNNNTLDASKLTQFLSTLPESRYNMASYYIQQSRYAEAFQLLAENAYCASYWRLFTLRSLLQLRLAQEKQSWPMLKDARDNLERALQLMGKPNKTDGLLTAAAFRWALSKFDEASQLLDALAQRSGANELTKINQAKCLYAAGKFQEALEILKAISFEPHLRSKPDVLRIFLRCTVLCKQQQLGVELITQKITGDSSSMTTSDEVGFVAAASQFANDCFCVRLYYEAATIWDVLMKRDRSGHDWWPAKRAAILALFRDLVCSTSSNSVVDDLRKIVSLLGTAGMEEQRRQITALVQQWRNENQALLTESGGPSGT